MVSKAMSDIPEELAEAILRARELISEKEPDPFYDDAVLKVCAALENAWNRRSSDTAAEGMAKALEAAYKVHLRYVDERDRASDGSPERIVAQAKLEAAFEVSLYLRALLPTEPADAARKDQP